MAARPVPIRKDPDEFLLIDSSDLIREWREMPSLYRVWATKLAKEKRKLRTAKAAFKVAKLLAARKVRKNPGAYGLKTGVRVTKIWLDDAVNRQPAIVTAANSIDEFEYQIDIIAAVVNSIRMKKEALQDIVRCHLSDYYSDSSGKDDAYVDSLEEITPESPPRRRRRPLRKTTRSGAK